MRRVVHLQNEHWQVGAVPEVGGAFGYARVRVRDRWADLLRPTPSSALDRVGEYASYPLVPWSNRIGNANFAFRGREHRLRVNSEDGTAIHGVARDFAWRLDAADSTRLCMSFDSRAVSCPWPFAFECGVELVVEGERFSVRTWVRSHAAEPFPAGFGHHPYFARSLVDAEEVEVELRCSAFYEAKRCIPTSGPRPVEPRVDFRRRRPLGDAFVDDCLTGRMDEPTASLWYPQSRRRITMRLDAIYGHVVVYVPRGERFFAIEPVTHVNDAFNRLEAGYADTGVFELAPGEQREGTFTLEVHATEIES